MSTLSSDLNEIEFSFCDENCSNTTAPQKIDSEREMEHARQMVSYRSITAEVIAKIQAVDKGDVLATGNSGTSVKPQHELDKGSKMDLNGASNSRATTEGDHLDETRFTIRNVPIVKSSTSPLGFFIRQGDGVRKQGIFVSRIAKGSLVDTNALFSVGDELISVNYVEVEGFSLDDVVRLIQIPRKLILTIKTSALSIKPSLSVGDASNAPTVKNKTAEKGTWKVFESKDRRSRANDYKEVRNRDKQSKQTERENFKVDNNNANEDQDLLRSSEPTQSNSTIEELIRAIREQNSRSKNPKHSLESGRGSLFTPQVSRTGDAQSRTTSTEKARETKKVGAPKRNLSDDSIILSKRTPPSMTRKSSTLTPVTSVNLIFDDPEDFAVNTPIHKSTVKKNSFPRDDSLKTSPPPLSSRSSPCSPAGSPKMRRRLPSVPSDNGRLIRSSGDSGSESNAPAANPSKPLLALPPEPSRSRRMLPTPPSSPNSSRRESNDDNTSPENQGSVMSDNESLDEKSIRNPSPSRKDSGKTLSQLFNAFTSRNQSDTGDAKEKRKDSQEKTESSRNSSSTQRSPQKVESTQQDILEQQKHSVPLHSFASGGLQPPSFQRRLLSRSSHPNLLMTLAEEPAKDVGKNSAPSHPANVIDNSKASPKFFKRRASLTSIGEKNLANEVASQDMTDIGRLRSEAEPGFMIFPDDYAGQNLLSSHAVSGMVSLHMIKATNLQFTDKKLLEKKKKVHCAVEVDFEQKALTSSKRASKTLVWDEMFEVEIQHGRELSLSCYTSSHEFDKPVAKVSFNLSPFVRFGKAHKVVFRMQPQGVIHLEMGFVEMRALLKRAPSDRASGVFGFQINVTSRNENSGVPLVVRKCVEEIERRGLTCQGLYRISGNARRKKQLHAQFDEDSGAVDLSEENYPDINVIAGILKDYLRELPEPLITESFSKLLVKAAKDQVQDQDLTSQKRLLSKLLVQLPQINRETLVYLLNHFMRVIAEKDTNKMDAHNLSVCFGPVLLCPPANLTESKDLLDLKLHIKVVEFLFFLWKNANKTSA